MARVLKEARGRSDDACSEAEQEEAKIRKLARNQRIQNTGSTGMQSGRFDWKVRGVTNLPATKLQKGIAGEIIQRGEVQALHRLLHMSKVPSQVARSSASV